MSSEKGPNNQLNYYRRVFDELDRFEYKTVLSILYDRGDFDEIFPWIAQRINELYFSSGEISINTEDLKQQFKETTSQSEVEMISNIMYLANLIARQHMKSTPYDELEGEKKKEVDVLLDLKMKCLEKLCKKRALQGESDKKELLIQKYIPPKLDKGDCYYILLPDYLEPFVVQCKSIDRDIANFYDPIPFYNDNNNIKTKYRKAVFPLKLTETMLEKIQNLGEKRELQAYFAMQVEFVPAKDRFKYINKVTINQLLPENSSNNGTTSSETAFPPFSSR